MLGKILGIPWQKIGYFLLPEFTGKSLSISGNLPITGNSKKTVNMNALYASAMQVLCRYYKSAMQVL